MSRIFRYILQTDNGMAPSIDDGIVSLATCKPGIRKSARVGDWVIGFRPGSAVRGLVVWAGLVESVLGVGDYERRFSSSRRNGRSDAIYREVGDGEFERLFPCYHPDNKQFQKDTGSPVLLFDPGSTWYFGRKPRLIPDDLLHLAAEYQGHRVNKRKAGDLEALQTWLHGIAQPDVHHPPTDRRIIPCATANSCKAASPRRC